MMTSNRKPHDILVVDDNRNNLRLLNDILTEAGYRVRPVPGGRMALSAAQAKTPDLILLDIMMPEMDGYAVCAVLKKDIRFQDIPVIFISALSETIDKVKAFDAGCVDYITKPFQPEEVKARVETHLSLRQTQIALSETNRRLRGEIEEREKTERSLRRTKTALEGTNDLLHNILSTSPIGICLIENGRFQWANRAMGRIFEYTDERELRGKPLEFIFASAEDYKTATRSLENGKGVNGTTRVDSRFRRKNGDVFTGHLKTSLSEASEPAERAIITLSDETWRVTAESEKLHREKLQGVLEMAGAVCHELNQPLQAISGYIEILQQKPREEPFLRDKIMKMLDQVEKMGKITRKLMKISTYETKEYLEGVKIIDIDKSMSAMDEE